MSPEQRINEARRLYDEQAQWMDDEALARDDAARKKARIERYLGRRRRG